MLTKMYTKVRSVNFHMSNFHMFCFLAILRRVLRRVLETAVEEVLRRVLRRCLAVGFRGRKGSEKGS